MVEERAKYEIGAKRAAIGAGVALLGNLFDWSFVDNALMMGGSGVVGYYCKETFNYVACSVGNIRLRSRADRD